MATGDPPPLHPPHEVDDKRTPNPPKHRPQATISSVSSGFIAIAETSPAQSLPPLTQQQQLNLHPQSQHPLAMESKSSTTIKHSTSNTAPLENLQSKSFFNSKKPAVVEPQPHRSFSQVLQGFTRPISSMEPQPDLDMDSFLKPISILHGKPNVLFSLSQKKVLVDKLKLVLVGKFSHGMPLMNQIRNFFSKIKLLKPCTVSVFDRKHIFIECFCKIDYDYIWLHLAWVIEGFTMRVFKWSDQFNPTTESAIVPVWVRLEGIPLYMFDEKSLLAIANTVGKPIKVDPRNVSHAIVSSARICVELDVSKPLVDSIWVSFEDDITKVVVEGFRVKIMYDEVPPYCAFCCHIGHWVGSCKRREEKGLNMDQSSPVRDCSAVETVVQVLGAIKSKQVTGSNSSTQQFELKDMGVEFSLFRQNTADLVGIGSKEKGVHLEHDSGKKGLKQVDSMLARQILKGEDSTALALVHTRNKVAGPLQEAHDFQVLGASKQVQTQHTTGLLGDNKDFSLVEDGDDRVLAAETSGAGMHYCSVGETAASSQNTAAGGADTGELLFSSREPVAAVPRSAAASAVLMSAVLMGAERHYADSKTKTDCIREEVADSEQGTHSGAALVEKEEEQAGMKVCHTAEQSMKPTTGILGSVLVEEAAAGQNTGIRLDMAEHANDSAPAGSKIEVGADSRAETKNAGVLANAKAVNSWADLVEEEKQAKDQASRKIA